MDIWAGAPDVLDEISNRTMTVHEWTFGLVHTDVLDQISNRTMTVHEWAFELVHTDALDQMSRRTITLLEWTSNFLVMLDLVVQKSTGHCTRFSFS